MLRFQKWSSVILAYLALYSYHLTSLPPPLSSHFLALPALTSASLSTFSPLLILAVLALHAVTDIMYTVLTFNDCKEAAKEIDDQVKEAHAAMKKRKIPITK